MKLYWVEISAYGSFGAMAIAETEERAVQLFLEKNPTDIDHHPHATLLTDDLTKEYVQDQMWE
jgi:hypothetical protein